MFQLLTILLLLIACLRLLILVRQQRTTKKALQKSEVLLRNFIENSPGVKFIKDPSGRLKFLNKAFDRQLERGEEPDFEWMPKQLAESITQNDHLVISDNLPSELIEVVPIPGGLAQYWLVNKFCLFTDGRPHVAGIAVNITNQKQIENDLLKLNQQLNEFAYVASHDLQAPLRAIASFLQRLNKSLEGKISPKESDYVLRSIQAAKNMKTMIDDLLELSRNSSIKITLRPVELDLVMRGVMQNLQVQYNALLIDEFQVLDESIIRIVSPLPCVSGDCSQLIQLFQNIIGNSLKFQVKGNIPIVDISCIDLNDSHWQIIIKDNGIGIDLEFSPTIFNLFTRLNTQDEYPGTGVGLAICKQIIERHQGKISLESVVGVGTTFYIDLQKG